MMDGQPNQPCLRRQQEGVRNPKGKVNPGIKVSKESTWKGGGEGQSTGREGREGGDWTPTDP